MSYTFFKKQGVFLLVILCLSYTGTAHALEGCDPDVMAALNAKAKAKIAYDVAVIEQMIEKPESVLKMTCFNKQAGAALEAQKKMFTGKDADQTAAEEALQAGLPEGETIDRSGGPCTKIKESWDKIGTDGIKPAPRMDDDALRTGAVPAGAVAADSSFQKSVDANKAVYSAYDEALTKVEDKKEDPKDFSEAETSCEALAIMGITPPDC